MTTGNTTIERVQPKFKDQKHQVLWHFQQHGSLTSGDADRLYGIARLASRIKDLRDLGHIIETEKRPFKTRLDKKGVYGRYLYKGFNPDYVKPEKADNSGLLEIIKLYVSTYAFQKIQTYNSRFLKGLVTKGTLDKYIEKQNNVIDFANSLK